MQDIILEKFGDHGADSSRRDRFQEHYAAQLCIEMLSDSSISEVICEYGEDVVIKRNGAFELFQVKTKQESVDDWKLQDLLPIISKTFAMVPYFEYVSRCCFVSNKGAAGVLYSLKAVLNQPQNKWNDSENKIFEDFCRNHSQTLLREIKKHDPDASASIKDINKLLLKLEIITVFSHHMMNFLEDTNLRSLRKCLENNSWQNPIILLDQELAETYDRLLGDSPGKEPPLDVQRKKKTIRVRPK